MPYMFIIVTGALQSRRPTSMRAADLDGANPLALKFQEHHAATALIPLLPVAGGLLSASSNFTVVQTYNNGGPPMIGTASPVGHTDILAIYLPHCVLPARQRRPGFAARSR